MAGYSLKHYIDLTQFLGLTLGPDYEVTLLDTDDPENAVVAIANGHVSGRTVGAPLTEMVRRLIENGEYKNETYRVNYPGLVSENGSMLRSSCFHIKSDEGRLLGMLCINFDDSRYRELSDKLLKLRHPDMFVDTNFVYNKEKVLQVRASREGAEQFHGSVADTAAHLVRQVERQSGVPVERMTKEEKLKIITMMDERGMFMVKNAVKITAGIMHCSPATIYRYIRR